MINTRLWHIFLMFFTVLGSSHTYAASCEFLISNEWNSGYTASVTITNDTNSTIDGWTASIEFADGITVSQMWNASISGTNPYLATNNSYNREIQTGKTISFGFNAQKKSINTPVQIPLLGGICNSNANNRPTARASASILQGTIPLTVDFDASASTDPDGDELSYRWQFNDNTTSIDITPTHTFSEPGIYTIVLIVSDGYLESAPTTLVITAKSSKSTSALCEYKLDNEWNSGFTSSIKITNVEDHAIEGWNVSIQFPEATASISDMWNANISGNNPYQATHKSYNSKIEPNSTVTFGFNSVKSTTGAPVQAPLLGELCASELSINHPPDIDVTTSPLDGTVPLIVNLDASHSADPDGDELVYLWNFDDGTSSNDAVITRSYTEAGTYMVSLTVTDSQQASSARNFTITAKNAPIANTYILDAQSSSVFFVSTKNTHIIESHTFTDFNGEISAQGEAIVSFNLDSINSGIAIRDQRMRNLLFETTVFNQATVNLTVDMDAISDMSVGSLMEQMITPQIDLHGFTVPIATQVSITRLNTNTILVQNANPILINAEDFGLTSGIEALRTLAGINLISYSVPVNFTLLFNRQ